VTTPVVVLSLEGDLAASIYYKFNEEEDYILYEEEFEVPDGAHILYWYAIDPAGNAEAEHAEEISVDTTIPVTTLVVQPNKAVQEWYTEIPNIEFQKSEEEAIIYYHWDYEKPIQLSNALVIPEGRHVLYFFAKDEAGNTEEEQSREFRVDTQRPVAILTAPTSVDEDKAITLDGSNSKDSNEVVSWYFDFGDGQNSGWITSPTTTHTYKKDGVFTISLKVKDKAGLESEPQSQQIKVKKKSSGGGGIFDPGDPDDPDGEVPFYKKSIDLAGMSFPFWLLLLLLLVILAIIVAVAVAARRRGRRKRAEQARELERDIGERWRPRKDEDISYDDAPTLRATEPYEFGYPSYETEADDVEITQMAEPLPTREPEPEVPIFSPVAAAPTKPAEPEPVFQPVEEEPPKPEPKPEPLKAKATPVKAEAKPARMEEPKVEAKEPEPTTDKKPDPGPEKKKGEDIDLDSEISDILSRLDL
jgi:PKD repeat protein